MITGIIITSYKRKPQLAFHYSKIHHTKRILEAYKKDRILKKIMGGKRGYWILGT
jgi:hypothetical protein